MDDFNQQKQNCGQESTGTQATEINSVEQMTQENFLHAVILRQSVILCPGTIKLRRWKGGNITQTQIETGTTGSQSNN